jgi:hypothetical protein
MLRILIDQDGADVTLSLHGRLAGPTVALLDRNWQSLVRQVPSARLTTVLSDVSFIDIEGERLLARMHDAGVILSATGCLNRHVVRRIEACARRPEPNR